MAKRNRRRRYAGPDLTSDSGLKAGDTINLQAGRWDERGNATAVLRGAPISIQGAIHGESVKAEVVKVFPERVAAKTVEVEDADDDRVVPKCRYFGECSGCQWQHVSYSRQLETKREIVINALRQFPETTNATVDPAIGSPMQYGYRNHARFTIGRREASGFAGYVNADSRQFVRIDECLIMDDQINAALAKLQGRLHRMTQWSVRVGANSGDQTIQPLLPADIQDVESGRQHYTESINGIDFNVAASSFFQVNSHMIPVMTQTISEMLDPTGDETLIDLYCGVGTFACLLADKVYRVIGIEESASAIKNAKTNAAPFVNVELIGARADTVARELEQRSILADFVIVDPPRIGCDDATIAALSDMQPSKIIMVSCEPKTLARDLAALCRAGFTLIRVQPLDMFPQTKHIEAVALLVREDAQRAVPEKPTEGTSTESQTRGEQHI